MAATRPGRRGRYTVRHGIAGIRMGRGAACRMRPGPRHRRISLARTVFCSDAGPGVELASRRAAVRLGHEGNGRGMTGRERRGQMSGVPVWSAVGLYEPKATGLSRILNRAAARPMHKISLGFRWKTLKAAERHAKREHWRDGTETTKRKRERGATATDQTAAGQAVSGRPSGNRVASRPSEAIGDQPWGGLRRTGATVTAVSTCPRTRGGVQIGRHAARTRPGRLFSAQVPEQ